MKKYFTSVLSLLVISVLAPGTACSDNKDKAPAAKKTTAAPGTGALPNYRYVDTDSVLAKYNLSKDFEEQMLRMQNDFDSEARKHENSLRNMQSSMQNKMQTNAYTEATYKADQERLAQMGNQADRILGQKQQAIQQATMDAQKVLNDSIQNFINDYNKVHGYDAIFYKAATVYIDPRLDITDEVVEGLNARYNKVKK